MFSHGINFSKLWDNKESEFLYYSLPNSEVTFEKKTNGDYDVNFYPIDNNDVTYSALAYGGDAVDRIKAGKSYDYMLIEDDMKEMSGLATLQELQKLKNFDIPVIIMLNKDKDSIKEHYIEDGFTDYLLTDNLEEEIKRIIDKY